MSGGALGKAAGTALHRGPSQRSVLSSTFLLAGSQALGILLEPSGVRRATFNDFSVSPGEASDTVPYIAGTVETVPHLISYFDFHSKKVKNDTQVSQMLINAGLDGLAGYVAGGGTLVSTPPTAILGLAEGTILGAVVAGLGQLRTASYRYYCGFLYGICHGPIDSITAVKVDERIVSFGATAGNQFLIDDPSAWGGDHVDGGVYALCKAIPGNFWPTQQIDPYIATQLGVNTASWSGKALFLVYGFTGYPESGYFAATPQGAPSLRPLKLRVRRLPDNLGVSAYHDINGDANIAECCFEWLTSPTFGVKKLPLSKIDVASFQAGAQTHFNRGLGISLEMNADTDVESALDKFTALGDSIIYGSFNSGTIRYKIIERDYSIASLPVFRRGSDGSSPEAYNVIKVDGFTPGSWANTANDFTFDYIDRNNNYLKATRYVQDTANKMLTGRTRSLSQQLEGVSNGATAALVGTRELRAGSYPRPPINLTVNRDGYALEPGDVIKYIDNVDNFVKVLRVAEVQALATDNTAEIQLNCTEDQYGVGAAAFSPYVAPGFTLTLHLHFELEDDANNLQDVVSKFIIAPFNQGLGDSLNLLDDALDLSTSIGSLALNDVLDNLSDSLTTGIADTITESLNDSIDNLSDSFNQSLAVGVAHIIFIAGAEHEAAGNDKWKQGGTPSLASSITGSHGRYYDNAASTQTVALPTSYSVLSLRCRFQARTSQSGSTRTILKFFDSGSSQVGIHRDDDGAFSVRIGNTSLVQSSATGLISLNTWYWAELAVVISNSGSYDARLYDDSGTLITTLSGNADTQATANASANQLLGGDSNIDTVLDDVSVSSASEILGRCQVETLYPNGAGDLTNLARGGTDSGANWSQVDEATHNSDTDYVSASSDLTDSYTFQSRSLTGTPHAIQVVATARSTVGSPQIRLLCRISGVTYEGSITHTLSTSYKCYYEAWPTNPATGGAWTDSDINSTQFGVRCLATNIRVTQLVAEVLVQI